MCNRTAVPRWMAVRVFMRRARTPPCPHRAGGYSLSMKLNASVRIRRMPVILCLFAIFAVQTARAQSNLSIQPNSPLADRVEATARALNYVWALLAGFLVMFMQSGFALIETGMCRAKNAAHTMSMNMMVYALAMAAFFVCGFAFMCGGVNGVEGGPGGPATLGLDHVHALHNMLTVGQKHWGLLGARGFFLLGGVHRTAGAMVWFLYMMVFMD